MNAIIADRSTFDSELLMSLKKEVQYFRNELKNFLSSVESYRNTIPEKEIKRFKKLYNNKFFVWFQIINQRRDVYNRLDGWKNERRTFPIEDINFIKSSILIFLTETTL